MEQDKIPNNIVILTVGIVRGKKKPVVLAVFNKCITKNSLLDAGSVCINQK